MSRRALLAPIFVAAVLNEAAAQSGHRPALDLRGATELASQQPAPVTIPYRLEADRLEGRHDGVLTAQGDVRVSRADDRVTADWVRYDPHSDTLEAVTESSTAGGVTVSKAASCGCV